MTKSETKLVKTVEENIMYIGLMQENINDGVEVDTSREIINILFSETVNAKKKLANHNIITV